MPPVISIVGRSASGKTTFIEKLVRELSRRSYRVAVIKHAHQDVAFDRPGKDSRRYIEAGAWLSIVGSSSETAFFLPAAPPLAELVRLAGEDYDLILTEGFKSGPAPKIEVRLRRAGPPLEGLKKLFAIITDEPVATRLRQFSHDDFVQVANLLEEGYIKPQRRRLSVYINGGLLTLKSFPRRFITNVILAMVSGLKGVAGINRLDIHFRRPDGEDSN